MNYKPKTCRCGTEFTPTGPRQLWCRRDCPAKATTPRRTNRRPAGAEMPTPQRPTRRPRPDIPPEMLEQFQRVVENDVGDLSPSELGERFRDLGRAMRRLDTEAVQGALFAIASGALVLGARPDRIALPRHAAATPYGVRPLDEVVAPYLET